MGISGPVIYGALQVFKRASKYPINGPAFDDLAWAIADGVDMWIGNPTNVVVMGFASGIVGVGTIPSTTSNLVLAPVIPLMNSALAGSGVRGPLASSLATTVTLAMAQVVTQFGGYSGVCPTVSIGTDLSKVVYANGSTLAFLLKKSMQSYAITGPASTMLAQGLGTGIAALLMTTFGTGKVVGVPGPAPGAGPSFSKVG